MKNLLLLFFLLPFAVNAQSQFQLAIDGQGNDYGYSARQTFDGGYIAAGTIDFPGYPSSLYLAKLNALGDTMWTRIVEGIFSPYSISVQQTSDSGYVVACTIGNVGAGQYDACLVRVTAGGLLSWIRTWGGPLDQWAWAVDQTSDGGFIVTGASYDAGYADIFMIRVNANGSTRWKQIAGVQDEDWAYDVQQTSDGGFILCGFTYSSANDDGAFLMKTDSSGTPVWVNTYGAMLDAYSVREVVAGGYILTGRSASNSLYLLRTDATGGILWQKKYDVNTSSYLEGKCVRETSDGGFIVTGNAENFGQNDTSGILLLKTDWLGNYDWSTFFNSSTEEYAYCVEPTSDGGYIVAGYIYVPTWSTTDLYLIKTDSLGQNNGCNLAQHTVQVANTTAVPAPIPFLHAAWGSANSATLNWSWGGLSTIPCFNVGVEEPAGTLLPAPFPNPAAEAITITVPAAGTLIFYDATGREVKRMDVAAAETKIMVTDLPDGVYCYALQTGTVRTAGKPFVVAH